MKKGIAFILLITLVVSVAFTGYGKEVPLFTTEMYEKVEENAFNLHVKDVIMEDEVLYALFHNRIYRYDMNKEEPELLYKIFSYEERKSSYYIDTYEEAKKAIGEKAEELVHSLFFWQDCLYGFNKFSYRAMAFNPLTGQRVKEKDMSLEQWSLMGEESYSVKNSIDGVVGNKLFVRHLNYEKYEEGNQLFSFDLLTGQRQSYDIRHVKIVLPYKNNQLLAVVFDENRFFREELQEGLYPKLVAFDPETGKTEDLFSLQAYQASGITYSQQEDCIYYCFQGEVFKTKMDGTQTTVGYITNPYSEMDQKAWSVQGKKYVLWKEWSGVYTIDIKENLSQNPTLTVYGDWIHIETPKGFEEKYPDMPVIHLGDNTERYNSFSQLIEAVENQSTQADIFYLFTEDIDISKIIQGGAAYPLEGSEYIRAKVEDMYPAFKSYFESDGEIYTVPYIASIIPNLYLAPNSWEQLGLTDRQPTTVVELLNFVYEWQEKLQVKYPDYYLLAGQMMTKSFLINYTLNEYQQYYEKKQLPITFDTPLFRQLMAQLKKIDLPLYESDTDYFDDPNSDNALFTSYGDDIFSVGGLPATYPLFLPLDEGYEATAKPFLQVAIVNPSSEQREAAVVYLEGMMEEYDHRTKATLFKSENQPVKSDGYEDRMDYFGKSLKKSKDELSSAKDEEEIEILENAIEYFETQLNNKEDYYWEITPQRLALYENLMPSLFVSTTHNDYDGVWEQSMEMGNLIEAFMIDKIPLEDFIKELEKAAGNAG